MPHLHVQAQACHAARKQGVLDSIIVQQAAWAEREKKAGQQACMRLQQRTREAAASSAAATKSQRPSSHLAPH